MSIFVLFSMIFLLQSEEPSTKNVNCKFWVKQSRRGGNLFPGSTELFNSFTKLGYFVLFSCFSTLVLTIIGKHKQYLSRGCSSIESLLSNLSCLDLILTRYYLLFTLSLEYNIWNFLFQIQKHVIMIEEYFLHSTECLLIRFVRINDNDNHNWKSSQQM